MIVGDSLSVAPSSIIAGLRGFGTSLASGVDVDNNEYYGRVVWRCGDYQLMLSMSCDVM